MFRADETESSCAAASAEPGGRRHQMDISPPKITDESLLMFMIGGQEALPVSAKVTMATT